MKDQQERPSQYSEEGTDNHSKEVDGDVVREEQIRQKEEDQPNDRVTYKRAHIFSSFATSIGSLRGSLSSVPTEKNTRVP